MPSIGFYRNCECWGGKGCWGDFMLVQLLAWWMWMASTPSLGRPHAATRNLQQARSPQPGAAFGAATNIVAMQAACWRAASSLHGTWQPSMAATPDQPIAWP